MESLTEAGGAMSQLIERVNRGQYAIAVQCAEALPILRRDANRRIVSGDEIRSPCLEGRIQLVL
jgi:hypothetical protein